MVILHACMLSHKIYVMCGVEWKYFLYIFGEKTITCLKGPSQILIF